MFCFSMGNGVGFVKTFYDVDTCCAIGESGGKTCDYVALRRRSHPALVGRSQMYLLWINMSIGYGTLGHSAEPGRQALLQGVSITISYIVPRV